MPSLIVRNIESSIVQRLREESVRHGVSMEEEHRRVLRKSLLGSADGKKLSLKEFLSRDGSTPPIPRVIRRRQQRVVDL
ncbi:hypothetical protein QPK87_25625 [Kamptonema cortianum]|nr:hypothetical protein [Oscillatoria laete-virens]MDK3159914.1 hypothetical protein [Kamptonema cortianum]MDL5050517.1 hypothetical protein [Oscillatoria amoena NRMC-F 0135]MDL5055529.1 hypothetical protein [Oscillatoria laete-virens NRMC-F 0139]